MKKVDLKSTLFPTKESLLKKDVKFKQVEVYSNHYIPNIDKSISFTEWYMKIFKYKDENGEDQIKLYEQSPNSIKSEINPDSRDVIREIYFENFDELKKQTGRGFYSG